MDKVTLNTREEFIELLEKLTKRELRTAIISQMCNKKPYLEYVKQTKATDIPVRENILISPSIDDRQLNIKLHANCQKWLEETQDFYK